MTRYFIALPIPQNLRQRLALLRANLPDARWIEPDDYHLTLRFLGDCERPTMENIIAALDEIDEVSFTLKPSAFGIFGHDKPRALWLGVETCLALTRLHDQVDAATRRAGLPPDGRKFTPHITLARLSRGRPETVARALHDLGSPELEPFEVDEFGLYFSGRSRGGGPYVLEESFPLRVQHADNLREGYK